MYNNTFDPLNLLRSIKNMVAEKIMQRHASINIDLHVARCVYVENKQTRYRKQSRKEKKKNKYYCECVSE